MLLCVNKFWPGYFFVQRTLLLQIEHILVCVERPCPFRSKLRTKTIGVPDIAELTEVGFRVLLCVNRRIRSEVFSSMTYILVLCKEMAPS